MESARNAPGQKLPADMRIRTLIVDDEAPARARIRHLLKNEGDFEVIGECANGRQAVAAVQKQRPDLVFLDVQMPRLSGFEVCAAIAGEAMPLVIFVTAFDQYALQAFDVHAIDYLLKPFDRERFQKSLRHAREQLRRGEGGNDRLAALLENIKPDGRKRERLAFKANGRVILVRIEEIDWIEADGNYVQLRVGAASHQLRETISGLETQLASDRFMRISRSVIVNLDRIKELQPLFYGDYAVILQNGTRLTLSRNFRDRLEKLLERRS
jgi:two-component system LytT family response regulator